jgi:aspartyl protease family protein
MSGDQLARTIWYILALVLVVSALASRRMSLRGTLGMILAWAAIFAVVLGLFSFRREIGLVMGRMLTELTGAPRQSVSGGAIRVAASQDGHYWLDGTVDGKPARFLIDSGATVTALSESTAAAAGLDIDRQRIAFVDTANGQATASHATVRELRVGAIHASDLPVLVSPAFGEVNVLGMNFLSQLRSWRVEDDQMVLQPRAE